jgi:phosphatidylglycerol---prolipoprotein diacylglyceryl transferase
LFPYIHVPTLFGIIQPFGVLVASGVLLGTWMMRKYVERNRLDEETMRFLGIRILIIGFIACHLFNVFFYEWDRLWGIGAHAAAASKPGWIGFDWKMLLNPFDGISSWGGILGGTFAFLWYARKLGLDRLAWADALSWGAIGGWVPGRAACAVAHDHTSWPSDFFLAIKVPEVVPEGTPALVAKYAGQSIHDLGLYETLILIPILGVMVLAERIPNRKPGLLMGILAVIYSVPRFFLDFLRFESTDPRHGGLTFAQWCCIAGLIFGCYLLLRPRRAPAAAPSMAEAVDAQATVPLRPGNKKRPGGGKKKKR